MSITVLTVLSWKVLQKLISLLHEQLCIINLTCNVDETVYYVSAKA